MTDYRGAEKDYTLRFQVVQYASEASPGFEYIGVHQVGSSFAAYRAAVSPDGTVYEFLGDSLPPEAQAGVDRARSAAYTLSQKRKAARSK